MKHKRNSNDIRQALFLAQMKDTLTIERVR